MPLPQGKVRDALPTTPSVRLTRQKSLVYLNISPLTPFFSNTTRGRIWTPMQELQRGQLEGKIIHHFLSFQFMGLCDQWAFSFPSVFQSTLPCFCEKVTFLKFSTFLNYFRGYIGKYVHLKILWNPSLLRQRVLIHTSENLLFFIIGRKFPTDT